MSNFKKSYTRDLKGKCFICGRSQSELTPILKLSDVMDKWQPKFFSSTHHLYFDLRQGKEISIMELIFPKPPKPEEARELDLVRESERPVYDLTKISKEHIIEIIVEYSLCVICNSLFESSSNAAYKAIHQYDD